MDAIDHATSNSGLLSNRLTPMFEPRTIAVAGASERDKSFGLRLAQSVLSAGDHNKINFINPRYSTILGRPCHAGFSELDEAPDLAVLGVGAQNLERSLADAIKRGARSAVIFDACQGETAAGGSLLQRLRDMALEADIPVCGGSGMGIINVPSGCVASFYGAGHLKPGGITLIAHSGSVFTTLAMNDPRFRFDLMVSSGQEIGATIDEYIDYAVTRSSTKVIAVFMEAARDPSRFLSSLKRARDIGVPVVVCKVGRTEESARMARSHTGAIAGSRSAYDAAFEEAGAITVDTVDQLMNVALLCSTGRFPAAGGVGLVTDSGGLRELTMDIAAEAQAPLARFSPATQELLRAALPAQLEPSNPLDCAADLTDDFSRVFVDGVSILADAEEVSMIGLEADLRDDYVYEEGLRELAETLAQRTDKPCFFYTSFGRTNNRALGEALAEKGVPCINGAGEMLAAVSRLQAWADRRRSQRETAPDYAPKAVVDAWRERLLQSTHIDEHFALAMMDGFGVPAAAGEIHEDWEGLRAAASRIGYPVVLKTAAVGIDHKSDEGGVFLNLRDEGALEAAYTRINSLLGTRVIVQRMASKGVELAFGYIHDPDFGPIVMVSAGGVLMEYFSGRQFALAPVNESRALEMIERLPIARLLDGVRGAQPSDKRSAARAFSAFSVMCASMGDVLEEVDVNPVIVSETGALAVDGLVVVKDSGDQHQ
ncbi:acetate--CoA ligase family protein [Shinella sumterensis]|uniref:Acetate--CoA ligase family protein n=1 Tax=Shinella sumterensis TaxID=1967501 RepID=A0AA50DC10_9HYPH|nr:acetate--CoA ligase family protein [Shinella sumterensis]WLS01070.1 acetate--CoA ligase family protein [Shinella sumterensis]WLS11866.1 acetate--CoA ligase family protein [Shinella sumterensis]